MKDKFELAIYNRLRSGGEIAAELPGATPDRRRWMAVGQIIIFPDQLKTLGKATPTHFSRGGNNTYQKFALVRKWEIISAIQAKLPNQEEAIRKQ